MNSSRLTLAACDIEDCNQADDEAVYLLGQRGELLLMGVVNEDQATGIDPSVEIKVATVEPRSDDRDRSQVFELDEDVFLDRRRQERFPREMAIVFGDDVARPFGMTQHGCEPRNPGVPLLFDGQRVPHHVARRMAAYDEIFERVEGEGGLDQGPLVGVPKFARPGKIAEVLEHVEVGEIGWNQGIGVNWQVGTEAMSSASGRRP